MNRIKKAFSVFLAVCMTLMILAPVVISSIWRQRISPSVRMQRSHSPSPRMQREMSLWSYSIQKDHI